MAAAVVPGVTAPLAAVRRPISRNCLKRSQEKLAPGAARAAFGGGGATIAGLIVVVVWLLSGVYVVNPDEQGVVLRFGAFNRRHDAGHQLSSALADRERRDAEVTRENQLNVGYLVPRPAAIPMPCAMFPKKA